MTTARLFLILGLMVLVTSVAFAQEDGYGYGYPTHHHHHEEKRTLESINVDVQVLCDGTTITVTNKDGKPLDSMVMVSTATSIYQQGKTGDDGVVVLPYGQVPCGTKDVEIIANPSDTKYRAETVYMDFECPSCGPQPECLTDADCSATQQCSEGKCVSVPCECGQVSDHKCSEYDCCADSDCGADKICQDHSCVQKPPECTSDTDCKDTQYCDVPAGGTCKDVPVGDCGKVENHAFVAYGYECGAEVGCPSCPQGEICVDHLCKAVDVTCPTSGVVGDETACTAQEGGNPCANCDYQVTDPTGKTYNGKTGADGTFGLPLTIQGTYKVMLLKDGQPVKSIEVKSLPRAQPSEPDKPTVVSNIGTYLLALSLLLVLIVAAVLYWRGRSGRKGTPPK